MAKTKVEKKAAELSSWQEVDQALKEIAVQGQQIKSAEAIYNEAEQKERAKLNTKLDPKRARIEELELGIQLFCEDHRDEFDGKKTRELGHGLVSFRLGSPGIKALKGFTLASALNLIKGSVKWARRFVRMKEELDKEAIMAALAGEEMNAEELKAFGLQRYQDESFYYEVKLAAE